MYSKKSIVLKVQKKLILKFNAPNTHFNKGIFRPMSIIYEMG